MTIPDKSTLACLPKGYARFLGRKSIEPLRAYAANPETKILVWFAYDGSIEDGVKAALSAREEAVASSNGWCPEPNGSTLTFLTGADGQIAWIVSPNGKVVEDPATYRRSLEAIHGRVPRTAPGFSPAMPHKPIPRRRMGLTASLIVASVEQHLNATEATASTNPDGPVPSITKESPMAKKTTTKTAKAPRTKKTDERVVFAFRLTPAERDQIHKAAGAGKASQFVLEAALAAAKRA